MQNFQQQYSSSCEVITGSFDDLQHKVYAQIKKNNINTYLLQNLANIKE